MAKKQPKQNELILYNSPEGEVRVDVLFQDETVWLTQKQMAQLFDVDRSVITKHLQNIFDEGELEEKLVCDEKWVGYLNNHSNPLFRYKQSIAI